MTAGLDVAAEKFPSLVYFTVRLSAPTGSVEVEKVAVPAPLIGSAPLMAVLPAGHRLAAQKAVNEEDLAADLLVMADGHCLVNQSLAACGAKAGIQSAMQAATLETLVNLVVAGYGTTLVPALAASGFSGRGAELRPLRQGATRMIRLVSRPGFPRPQALRAIEKVVRRSVPAEWRQ